MAELAGHGLEQGALAAAGGSQHQRGAPGLQHSADVVQDRHTDLLHADDVHAYEHVLHSHQISQHHPQSHILLAPESHAQEGMPAAPLHAP